MINKINILCVLSVCILLLVLSAVAPVCWTKSIYVDVINGDQKYITTLFGFTCGNLVHETPYSVLVDRFGLRESSDWKLAVKEERGFQKMFLLRRTCYNATQIMCVMNNFAWLTALNGIKDPRKELLNLRIIFEQDGAIAGQKYVDAMWKKWAIEERLGNSPLDDDKTEKDATP